MSRPVYSPGPKGDQGPPGDDGLDGAQLTEAAPEPLGPAAVAGVATDAARADHVHPRPSLAELDAASAVEVAAAQADADDAQAAADAAQATAATAQATADAAATPAEVATAIVDHLAAAPHAPQTWTESVPVVPESTASTDPGRATAAGTLVVRVQREGDAPTTAGAYTLDVTVDGVSVLAAPLDLTTTPATAGTWSTLTLATPAIAAGATVQTTIASDNADLEPAPVDGVAQGVITVQAEVA